MSEPSTKDLKERIAELEARLKDSLSQAGVHEGGHQKLGDICDAIAVGVFRQDRNGKISNLNTAASRILGVPREDLLGRDLFHPGWEVYDENGAILSTEQYPSSRAFETGETVRNVLMRMWHAESDSMRWILTSAEPVFAGDEQIPDSVVVTLNDITSMIQALDSLDETREHIQTLADTIPATIITVDADERYLYTNKYYKTFWRLTLPDIIGKTVRQVIGEENYNRVKGRIARVLSGERVPYEDDVVDPSGSIHHMKGEYIPRFDDKSNVTGFFSFSHDITDHVRNEAALRESEERYRSLFYSSGHPVFILSDFCITECNTEAMHLFADSFDDVMGKTPLDFSPSVQPDGSDSMVLAREYVARALAGETVSFEWRHKNIDGSEFDADVTLSCIDSQRRQVHAIVRDITDQKQDKKRLQESREQFQELFDRMANGVAVYFAVDNGNDFIFKDLNRAAERLSKVKREDIIGRSVQEVFPGIINMGLLDVFREVWRTGQPAYHPTTIYQDESLTEWVENYVYKLSTGEVVAVYEDVTERKLAEDALAAETERLAVTLRSIGDAVIATDMLGNIVLMNPVAEELTGWSQDEAIHRPLPDIFHIINEKTRAICENPVDKVLAHGKVELLANHTVLICRDGTERVIADSGAPIRNETDMIIGVVLVFRDITHTQRIEEELQKAEKLESIGVLAGGIAHDFNNIMAAVLGNISVLKAKQDPTREEFQVLEDAEKACFHAKDLTMQLLTFAKGGSPVKKATEITEVIREAVKFSLRGSNVKCQYDFAEDLWAADVDRGQISQVLHNIVINADQAMPDGGEITVRAVNSIVTGQDAVLLAPGRYIVISVEDNGIGIDHEELEKIYDPYYSTKQGGSGLGLTTAYSVIHKHGGHIIVTSKRGEGSKFTFYLPASTDKPVAAKEMSPIPAQESWHILLMDDEDMVRSVAARMLSVLGNEVDTACDGVEAVEKYVAARNAGRPYDLVIMDLTIPGGMGGVETITQLLSIDPDVRAIISSGYSNDPVISQYASYGFRGFVRKPFNIKDLQAAMSGVLTDADSNM